MAHYEQCNECKTWVQVSRKKFIEWFYTDEEGGFIELLLFVLKESVLVALIILSVSEILYRTTATLVQDEIFMNSLKQGVCQ